jgi:hypothetical protein
MHELDSHAVERINSALVRAIAEAKALVEMGGDGDALRDVVRHARDLHGLLLEQMVAADLAWQSDCAACPMLSWRIVVAWTRF